MNFSINNKINFYRIIKAGYGSASIINDSTKKSSMSKFTLIIYDNTTKTKVEEMAALYKLPYYPFQAIPDYIMQVNILYSRINLYF